ncbi:4'-phosphopantetheinyl transferase superfamily protein [Streptomyces microflavus]|uniref:4'-phosphopantetheinyl transferase superfamily protein n=1 Tax=Streptomyces microflavus TaxID=1919 RepID=UPI00380F7727
MAGGNRRQHDSLRRLPGRRAGGGPGHGRTGHRRETGRAAARGRARSDRAVRRTGQHRLAGHPSPRGELGRLLFSAKESVFKVWYPLTGRELDFSEAEIGFAPAGRTSGRVCWFRAPWCRVDASADSTGAGPRSAACWRPPSIGPGARPPPTEMPGTARRPCRHRSELAEPLKSQPRMWKLTRTRSWTQGFRIAGTPA